MSRKAEQFRKKFEEGYDPSPKRKTPVIAAALALIIILLVMTIGEISGRDDVPSFTQMSEIFESEVEEAVEKEEERETHIEVHVIDVGQGDCTLVRCGEKWVLIDAGDKGEGQRVLKYLGKLGVEKLDLVVATHPHADHIWGLSTVLAGVKVKELIMPEIPSKQAPTSKCYEKLLDAIDKYKVKCTAGTSGMTRTFGETKMQILSPDKGAEYDDYNDYSVVLKFTCGDFVFLTCGDISKSTEKELIEKYKSLRASLLKISHHGSSDSSSKSFLEAVSPKYAYICAGDDNDFDHPNKKTLEKLNELRIKYKRTDEDSSFIFSSDGTDSVRVKKSKY